MPGITVGVDGSANARYALQWAIKEAASKHEPLTVLVVNEVAASFWTHQPVTVPADASVLELARQAATDLVDKTLSDLGEPGPASVTVHAINGFAVDELVNASRKADLVVLGARGGAQSGGLAHHAPLGSVCTKMLHHSKCPVVVVPVPQAD
ncbi:MAG TPA: universal stress protein [Streptosporangiaceae bacterium]|nr:universal stress protein [Streptosporangiaceae bacterium]